MSQDIAETGVDEKISEDPAGDALRSKLHDARLAERKSIHRNQEPECISRVGLEIGNSGASFAFQDGGHGPEIVIRSSAFGNITQQFTVITDVEGLKALRGALDKAIAFDDYTETYCHAARPR